MLTVELFSPGGKNPQVIEASRILVRDSHGNPYVLAAVFDDNQIIVSHVEDEEFDALLTTFGTKAAKVLHRLSL